MPVAVDTSFLVALIDESIDPDEVIPGASPGTMAPRINYFRRKAEENGQRVIIPAPALSEFLVGAACAAPYYLQELGRYQAFRVASFDELAAVELAEMEQQAGASWGRRRGPLPDDRNMAKVNFDRQIVAIARVHEVSQVIAADGDIYRLCTRKDDPQVVHPTELPLPAQQSLDLPDPSADGGDGHF
ncbi:MAG: hypothetical protein ACLFSI_02520 [Halorhodospira sp.]